MLRACATRDRFVFMTRAPLSLVIKIGVLRSRGDLIFGFLPWEALCVRAVAHLSGGCTTSGEDCEPVQNSFDDRHVMKGVVFEFYFVEVAPIMYFPAMR